jgi:hypothetical protein
MSHRALQRANQQVAEQERIVAEWAELIGRMHAESRDVTLAMELFDVFRTHLATYRRNRDRLKQSLRAEPAAPPMDVGIAATSASTPSGLGSFEPTITANR